MPLITVFIESREVFFRKDIVGLLSAQEDMQIVGEPAGWPRVLHSLDVLHPDVLLLDLDTDAAAPAGLGRLSDVYQASPRTKTLLVSDHCSTDLAIEVLIQHVKGCLAKLSPPETYLKAIRAVHGGDLWLGRQLVVQMVERLITTSSHREIMAQLEGCVTDREREVIEYVTQGMTNKEIAKALGISDKTVKTHLSHIFHKLKVGRRLKLLRMEG